MSAESLAAAGIIKGLAARGITPHFLDVYWSGEREGPGGITLNQKGRLTFEVRYIYDGEAPPLPGWLVVDEPARYGECHRLRGHVEGSYPLEERG